MCHIRSIGGTNDEYRLPPSSWNHQFRTDTFTCCTNTLILYMFSSTYFLFFHILFLASNRPRQKLNFTSINSIKKLFGKYIYIYIYKVMLATLVEGNLKVPFSIATTPRWRGGHYSILSIAPLYPWFLPYNAVLIKAALSTIFESFVWTDQGLNPGPQDQ